MHFFHGSFPIPFLRHRPFPNIAAQRPIIFVPGNHDRFSRNIKLRCPSDKKIFESVFGDAWAIASTSTSLSNGIRVTRFRKPTADLLVCCADLTLRPGAKNPLTWWGCGEVHNDLLEKLARLTQAELDNERQTAVVWVVHFPPECTSAKPFTKLKEGAKLIQRARECGVSLIFCGHTHEEEHYVDSHGTPPWVIVAGTATARRAQSGHQIYFVSLEVDGKKIQNAELVTHRLESGRFEAKGNSVLKC